MLKTQAHHGNIWLGCVNHSHTSTCIISHCLPFIQWLIVPPFLYIPRYTFDWLYPCLLLHRFIVTALINFVDSDSKGPFYCIMVYISLTWTFRLRVTPYSSILTNPHSTFCTTGLVVAIIACEYHSIFIQKAVTFSHCILWYSRISTIYCTEDTSVN